MHDLTSFEHRLADRLGREVERGMPAFDPGRIAAAAMVSRSPWDRFVNRIGAGLALPMAPSRRAVLVAVAALLVLATAALAIGALNAGGRRLAFVHEDGDVIVATSDGANPLVVGHIEPSPLRTVVSWAPGGRHLATFGEDWNLTILDSNWLATFSRHLDDRNSRFAWSADGAHLAVVDGAWIHEPDALGAVVDPHLFIVSAEGQLEGATDLPPDFRYTIGQGGVAWSRDGRQLAIAGYDARNTHPNNASSIWIVDRATLDVREIVRPDSPTYDVEPAWLPNGRVVFARMNEGIWEVDPATEAASVIYTPTCPCSGTTIIPFVPSPDGTRLAIVAPNIGLAILDLASGAVTELALPSGFGGNLPIGWTADGSGLVLRYGPITGQPFYAPDVAILDIATGTATVVARDVLAYDLRAN